jgi:hypothetical protein
MGPRRVHKCDRMPLKNPGSDRGSRLPSCCPSIPTVSIDAPSRILFSASSAFARTL